MVPPMDSICVNAPLVPVSIRRESPEMLTEAFVAMSVNGTSTVKSVCLPRRIAPVQ